MIRIKKILCPTDLSEASADALSYALALAHAYDAKLYLCYSAEGSTVWDETLSSMTLDNMRGLFANLIIRHLGPVDLTSINWEGLLIEGGGEPAEAITRVAAEHSVDLIVMRSRRRPHRAALLGSTAESVCRIAPCPVLVTHSQEREWVDSTTGEVNLKRVLVAYDFSDDAERALTCALSLAQEYQAELHLLHVLPKPTQDGPEIAWGPSSIEGAYHRAARRLQKAVMTEAYLWCKVKHAVRWGRPYQEILAYAKEEKIDLISMGAQGKNFSSEGLFGSNVDRVLRQAPCPVLVARPLKPNLVISKQSEMVERAVTL
ncbi:MAG TPA: universal stress protein [Pyrinomonadaceae bacterium]|nr:universal stress protein [Pyrinomonadaceae bacterium]